LTKQVEQLRIIKPKIDVPFKKPKEDKPSGCSNLNEVLAMIVNAILTVDSTL